MPTFPHRLCLGGIALLLLLTGAVQAQVPSSLGELSLENQDALLGQQIRREATQRILSASGVPLEGALDPSSYIVGPGDVFSVSIGGALPVQLAPVVTADGALILPELGSLQVAGRTLAAVRDEVQARLQRSYRHVATDVALAQPRQFYVHVSGDVTQPGRHVAIPIARVEDALAAAMRGNPLLVYQQRRLAGADLLPALRNVEVRRQSGEHLTVDLMRYYATGDTQYNPYLRDGDALYVPSFQRDVDALYVDRGSFAASPPLDALGGTDERSRRHIDLFDYRADDTVTDLLLVAGGPDLLAEAQTVRLLRTNAEGHLETLAVDVPAILSGTAEDPPLRPLDRVQLTQRGRKNGSVTAEGFVAHPGTYPIVEGETTLRDLVEAAGGIVPEGLLRGAYLERSGPPSPEESSEPGIETAGYAQQLEAAMAGETFENARLSDLSFGSRQYLTREVTEFQRVSLDLSRGLENLPPIPLRDGDRFVVPRDPRAVLVVGQVRYPGYVAFEPGADASYYLEQAGGKGPAATEVYLREAGTGAFRSPSGATIQSGDALFVDRTRTADTESLLALAIQERQVALQEENASSNRRFQYIQTGLAIVSTAVAVITTYLLINRDTN